MAEPTMLMTVLPVELFDLKNSLERGTPVAEIADFLCRSEKEVREKIAELKAGFDQS